ncbi:MAG: ABC transporter substrate-binding protein [Candidatus Paceibacterota bacterium]|jgi:branched-chain amino acid transport system substrate-binding protein
MSKIIKWVIAIVVIILVIIGLWYYSSKPTIPTETGPIKIGVIIPMTGIAAEYGANVYKSINLAVEDINKAGGILGRSLEVIYEDTKCDPKEGATAVQKLINVDKIDLLMASECSGPTAAAAPIVQQNKKVFLVALASVPGLTQVGDYIYRIMPSDSSQGKDLANAVLGYNNKEIAVLYVNNAYGVGIEKVFEKNIVLGGAQVVSRESFDENGADFKTQLSKIKLAKPDAVLFVAYNNLYSLIFKQAEELGLKANLFGSESLKDDKIVKELGKFANGTIVTYFVPADTPERESFIQKMKNKYGEDPGIYVDFAYDGVYVIKQAIEKAGSANPDAVKKALKSVSYLGATGLNEFDANREVENKPYSLYVIQNNQFVPLD